MTKSLAILATLAGYILMFITLLTGLNKYVLPYKGTFIWSSFLSAAALILGAMIISLFIKEPNNSAFGPALKRP